MKILNFFPLSILHDQINLSDKKKNSLLDEVKDMKNNSKNSNPKPDDRSWTGDTQGYEFIHKNPKFSDFFSELKNKINLYLDFLKIDKNQIETYIQRSWVTISCGKEAIAEHQHLQSHLSFAYYLKKSPEDSNFVLHD